MENNTVDTQMIQNSAQMPNATPPMPQVNFSNTPLGTPQKKSKLKIIISILIALGLSATIAVVILLWHPWNTAQTFFGWEAPVLPKLTQTTIDELQKKYNYDITYKPDLSSTDTITQTVKYDYEECERDKCLDAYSLYGDAALTKKLDVYTSLKKETNGLTHITFSGPDSIGATDSTKITDEGFVSIDNNTQAKYIPFMNSRNWGVAEMYFLVQRLDETGKKLVRPKVTVFTIKPDNKNLGATDVSASVDNNGALNVTWTGVQGAKEYLVVKVQRGAKNHFKPDYDVIARTDKTTVNMAEYNGDKKRAEKAMANTEILSMANSSFRQNSQLSYYDIKTEDSFYNEDGTNTLPNGKYNPLDNGLEDTSFAVIATNGTAFSPAREIDGNALLAQIPVSEAYHQQIGDLDKRKGKKSSFENLPTNVTVTMADGHTARKTIVYDASKAVIKSFGNSVDVKLPYKLQGTYLADAEVIVGVPKETATTEYIKTKTEEANKRNIAAQPPVSPASFSYSMKKNTDNLSLETTQKKIDTSVVSKTTVIPSIEYPINGTTPLVRYIAAHVMNGDYAIDLSDFYTDPTVDINDAYFEAIYQNPYAELLAGYVDSITLKGKVLTIHISGITKAEIQKRQQELYTSVTSAAATVTTPTMTDRQKALAINKWLIDNASYDYDAYNLYLKDQATVQDAYFKEFPYAWNAVGAAVKTKGVCISYAEAFKAISDKADLKAVYVGGTDNKSGSGHAWNKVFMDGKWQIVDTTWDDSTTGNITQYFGLTDAQADRVQDNEFVVDRFIQDYAAN